MNPIARAYRENRLAFLLLLFFYCMCGAFIWMIVSGYDGMVRLITEDGPLEDASALFYGISAAIFLYLTIKVARREDHTKLGKLFYLGFFLLFFLVMMEEISWGQRIFGIATPESFQSINYQGETNIHNTAGLFDSLFLNSLAGFFVPRHSLGGLLINTAMIQDQINANPHHLLRSG